MQVIAYTYTDPLLEPVPDVSSWGWAIARAYQDQGDRQQLQQLLQDCCTVPVQMLLVRRLAELGDSVAAVSDCLRQLERLGVAVQVLQEPGLEALDRSGPASAAPIAGNLPPLQRSDLLLLLAAVQESHRRDRIRHGHAQNRVRALPPPGKAPYGYRRGKDHYTIDRSTAPVVKDFFENFLLYGSLRGSVRYLQKKYNKKISVSTARRWLTSPVYRGNLEYQTGDVIPDTHAALISREEAAQIDRLLRRNRALSPRAASAPRSLAGLVTCAVCQSAMTITRVTARNKSQEYLYLRPLHCVPPHATQKPCGAIAYDQVLERTIQHICTDLPRAVGSASLPDLEQMKQQIEAQITCRQQVLNQLPHLQESGILDAETAELRAYKLRTEIAQLQDKRAQLPPMNLQAIAQVASLPQFWRDLSEAERRFYFREFIRTIQIVRQDAAWDVRLIFIF